MAAGPALPQGMRERPVRPVGNRRQCAAMRARGRSQGGTILSSNRAMSGGSSGKSGGVRSTPHCWPPGHLFDEQIGLSLSIGFSR